MCLCEVFYLGVRFPADSEGNKGDGDWGKLLLLILLVPNQSTWCTAASIPAISTWSPTAPAAYMQVTQACLTAGWNHM